ncbi:ribbon-helix-helix protein, CopG family [Archaeoglobus neptunius]|uniref:ribbon-helix-helix protein, CopG family n=1 Tax=Archaeoglobus neptunius TaxID=2798580 RepID=UPI001928510D|nr:ribbon-helix-helix protein, CopG family [Archaeoglobus neptunius]
MVERLSISLDDSSREKLEKLKIKTGKSTSEMVRDLIELGYEIYQSGVDFEALKAWIDYLAKRQHMILDIEHWRVIFNEIEKINGGEFWVQMEEIGLSHAFQYKMKGLDTVEKILRYVEKANWYEIKDEGNGVYTLILNDLKIKRFVKTFLEKVFEGQGIKAEVNEGFGKLIVVEK